MKVDHGGQKPHEGIRKEKKRGKERRRRRKQRTQGNREGKEEVESDGRG